MSRRLSVGLIILLLVVSACAKRPPRLTPDQRVFVEVPESESGVVEPEDGMDITIPAFNPLTAADPLEQVKARFRGTDRKGPKTSIAPGAKKTFDSLSELIDSLPDDEDMENHTPPLERDTMVRMGEENRNVRVTAWIYAIV